MHRRSYRQLALPFGERKTKAHKNISALRLRDRHANHLRRARDAQSHWRTGGHVSDLVVHRARFAAADVQHQLGDALDMRHGERWINSALKAVPGVGGKVEAARAPGDRIGPPECSLDVDVFGVVRDRRSVATHDAC